MICSGGDEILDTEVVYLTTCDVSVLLFCEKAIQKSDFTFCGYPVVTGLAAGEFLSDQGDHTGDAVGELPLVQGMVTLGCLAQKRAGVWQSALRLLPQVCHL